MGRTDRTDRPSQAQFTELPPEKQKGASKKERKASSAAYQSLALSSLEPVSTDLSQRVAQLDRAMEKYHSVKKTEGELKTEKLELKEKKAKISFLHLFSWIRVRKDLSKNEKALQRAETEVATAKQAAVTFATEGGKLTDSLREKAFTITGDHVVEVKDNQHLVNYLHVAHIFEELRGSPTDAGEDLSTDIITRLQDPDSLDSIMSHRETLDSRDRDKLDTALAEELRGLNKEVINDDVLERLLLTPSEVEGGERTELRHGIRSLAERIIDAEIDKTQFAQQCFRTDSTASRIVFMGLIPRLGGTELRQTALNSEATTAARNALVEIETEIEEMATRTNLRLEQVQFPVLPELMAACSDYLELAEEKGIPLNIAIPSDMKVPPKGLEKEWKRFLQAEPKLAENLSNNRENLLTYNALSEEDKGAIAAVQERRIEATQRWMEAALNGIQTALTSESCAGTAQLLSYLNAQVQVRFPENTVNAGRAALFLRFINPAEATPKRYNLVTENLGSTEMKTRAWLSKVLQNLGSNVRFGKKEPGRTPYNGIYDEEPVTTPFAAIGARIPLP